MVGARKAPSPVIMRVGRKHQATTMIFLGIFLDEEAVMYFDVVLVATNSKKTINANELEEVSGGALY
jgi:bacteriocin-like protein